MNHKNSTFYNKLVDLYAGRELSEELENELHDAAQSDRLLAQEMATLRQTVQQLQTLPGENYNDDTEYRIQMKISAWSETDILAKQESDDTWQYRLPMEG